MIQKLIFKTVGAGLNLWSVLTPERAAAAAGRLFATPPAPAIRHKEKVFLETARQTLRDLAGVSVMEYQWGDPLAPAILLSYGWGYNAGRWRHFVPGLTEAGYRVIAYDPPGHGLSPKGQLTVPINALIIRELIRLHGPVEGIVAHSFGGSSTVYALRDLPQRLHPQRMVVMASFSYAPRIFADYRQTLGLWTSPYRRMVRNFEQQIGHPIDVYDFAQMSAGFGHIEGLLVHAPADRVTPYAESRRYFDFWPGSRLFSPSEGGHHLGTAGITDAVLDFIVNGKPPAGTERQERAVFAGHELVRYFAGM